MLRLTEPRAVGWIAFLTHFYRTQVIWLRRVGDRISATGIMRQWTKDELNVRRKGDKGKVEIARRLRRETTMTLKWIAEHLAMGSWTNVSNLLATVGGVKRK